MARRVRIPNPLAEIARPGANRYVKSAGEKKKKNVQKLNEEFMLVHLQITKQRNNENLESTKYCCC